METNVLLQETQKAMRQSDGKICVSIIIPMHILPAERQADKIALKDAVANVKSQLLQLKYGNNGVAEIISNLENLYKKIDYTHHGCGIGIFVSPILQQLVYFAFPVSPKTTISDTFEIRDLLYERNHSTPYYVLLLTEKKVRLYAGRLNTLTEVRDKHFPQTYIEQYEYAHPSRANSYTGSEQVKSFEKDKSVLKAIRMGQFFKHCDKKLGNYLFENEMLLVMGASKEISIFKKTSKHKHNIVATISGNYSHHTHTYLEGMVWEKLKSVIDNRTNKLIKNYEEQAGRGHGVEGIENVWNTVNNGNALKLLVEKDYKRAGYINNAQLHLAYSEQSTFVPDAIDDIIETVLQKRGNVFFVENGNLKKHQHIALITRY